jgi:hypothetical protein
MGFMSKRKRKSRDAAGLKFSGGRFESKGFPLDGIDELEKYQRLVLEAAKQIWRQQNPMALRLPDHFEERVRLRLTDVRKGSVLPTLEREPQLALESGPDLLELSINYVDETFASIVENYSLPDGISEDMVKVVKLFGVSFTGNERATFRHKSDAPIRYDVETRRGLLEALAAKKRLTHGALVGHIRMLDAAQKFILVDALDQSIEGSFENKTLFDDFHKVHGLEDGADLVWLVCSFLTDNDGTVLKVEDVESVGLFAKSSNPWALPLAELATYPTGWLDGEGRRVELDAILGSLELLDAVTDAGYQTPSIFADIEGGVRLEWLSDISHTTMTIDPDAMISGYHLNISSGTEALEEGVAGKLDALAFLQEFIR